MPRPRKHIKVIHRKLGREKADGQAWKDKRIIEIDERITGRRYMETVIHEVLHIQNPDATETKITHDAKELSRLLWQLNFRTIQP